MVFTIGEEFVDGYTRAVMQMRMREEVKVWDPENEDFRCGYIARCYDEDDDGSSVQIYLRDEGRSLTVEKEAFILVVPEDEEENEYIPLVTAVLKSRADESKAKSTKGIAKAKSKAIAKAKSKAKSKGIAKAAQA